MSYNMVADIMIWWEILRWKGDRKLSPNYLNVGEILGDSEKIAKRVSRMRELGKYFMGQEILDINLVVHKSSPSERLGGRGETFKLEGWSK